MSRFESAWVKRVLIDHKKKGKVLMPPFLAKFGPMQEVSWVRLIVPELLWISRLHKIYGDHEAVEIITKITRSARSCFDDSVKRKFCFAAEWAKLTKDEVNLFRDNLKGRWEFEKFQSALLPLAAWYPEFPFAKLFAPNRVEADQADLNGIGELVAEMFERSSRHATLVQASVIWTAFDSGELVVNSGLALSRFPEVDSYPTTEISLQIATSIRATLNLLAGRDLQSSDGRNWSTYFWNRGVDRSGCNYE